MKKINEDVSATSANVMASCPENVLKVVALPQGLEDAKLDEGFENLLNSKILEELVVD